MKKEHIKMITTSTALGIFSVLSMSAAQATELTLAQQHAEMGISAEPDEDGYYVIYRPLCGKTLGTVSSRDLKYKLGRSLTCPDPTALPAQQSVFTILGHNTEFNLNGKTINCANDIGSGFSTGVSLSGDHGKLLGSYGEGNRRGKIINCPTGVRVGNIELTTETGHNLIKNVHAEDCYGEIGSKFTITGYGFIITSDHNRLENNIADCRQIVDDEDLNTEPAAGFWLGTPVEAAALQDIPFFQGNVFEGNYATNNQTGFYDNNNAGNAPAKSSESAAEFVNVFIDNGADFNLGDGFYVAGSGGEYLYNHANQNEGSGFVYSYDHYLNDLSGPRRELLLAKFEGNDAFKNDEAGFAAFQIDTYNSNGALFKDNVALFNNQADGFYHDLYDENRTCASDDAGIEFHNRWIHNLAFTANPGCTRGGRLVASSVESRGEE
jgi:hypothetical protein